MIEKMLNDTISTARLPIEERMINADLTSKILASRAQEKIQAKLPKPKPDSLPDPARLPTELPEGVNPKDAKPQGAKPQNNRR
jgi:hypothetical protein